MTQQSTLSVSADPIHYDFAELLVAYDFSEASDASLKYAVMLSKRFGSFIHLIAVQTPADYASALEAGRPALEMAQRDLDFSLQEVEQRLQSEGIWCDSVRRIGNVSDTIEGAILERTPNLLLLGAFGYGSIDRRRLGSTAEHLLRTIHCPTLVVGPQALLRDREAPPIRRILCAMSTLEGGDNIPFFAGHLATKLGSEVEFLHVVKSEQKNSTRSHCLEHGHEWLDKLRDRGITASCAVICGRAERQIAAHAIASGSSLILFGLHRAGNQMIDCQDGVVSATIRRAECPVMAVPSNYSY
jgi:nucleotide-binding universal stress UspA family protein